MVLTLSNVLSDLVVYGIFGVADYFADASILGGYGLLLIVPWIVGLRYGPTFARPAGVR